MNRPLQQLQVDSFPPGPEQAGRDAPKSHKIMLFPFTVLNSRGKNEQTKHKHRSSLGKRHRPSAGKPGAAGYIMVPLQRNTSSTPAVSREVLQMLQFLYFVSYINFLKEKDCQKHGCSGHPSSCFGTPDTFPPAHTFKPTAACCCSCRFGVCSFHTSHSNDFCRAVFFNRICLDSAAGCTFPSYLNKPVGKR